MKNHQEVRSYLDQCAPKEFVKAMDGRYASRSRMVTMGINETLRNIRGDKKLDRIGGLTIINSVMLALIIACLIASKIISASKKAEEREKSTK